MPAAACTFLQMFAKPTGYFFAASAADMPFSNYLARSPRPAGPWRGPSHCAGGGPEARVWLTVTPRQDRGGVGPGRGPPRPAARRDGLPQAFGISRIDSDFASIGVACPRRWDTWFPGLNASIFLCVLSWVLIDLPVTE